MNLYHMLDVSCIIINYNTSTFTTEAVDSIFKLNDDSKLRYEVVVVDNNSELQDYINLQEALNQLGKRPLKLIRSEVNTGFGGGNMLGVEHAEKARYYAFINNDTLQTTEGILLQLFQFMETTDDAGICSPQMLDENSNFRVTIDHFSSLQREILRRPLLEGLFPKTYLNRKIEYETPTKVHYVQGSFMFCDASIFHEVGGFDTNLFLYYEESDLSRRMLVQKKKHTYLIPSASYIHYKSKSIKKNIDIKIEQKISLLYYINKHFGGFQRWFLNTYYVIRYFFTSLFKPKYWPLVKVLIKGAPLSESIRHKN